MNVKQLIIVVLMILLIGFILLFPPKMLVRNGKAVMRFLPFETKKFESTGITIETSYNDPNLSVDWERVAPFAASVVLVGGLLVCVARKKNEKEDVK
ncbi:MAG TPA: hypothetical protein ENH41_00425 [Candidatus Omnitrophica bacterium]|nr:hypothetical protein [Candidatus Omnitrophota bacterium]